jgi:hypothetical protein
MHDAWTKFFSSTTWQSSVATLRKIKVVQDGVQITREVPTCTLLSVAHMMAQVVEVKLKQSHEQPLRSTLHCVPTVTDKL